MSSSSGKPILNIAARNGDVEADDRVDLLQNQPQASSSRHPQQKPLTIRTPPSSSQPSRSPSRLSIGFRKTLGAIGLGPRQVHSNHYRVRSEEDSSGRVYMKKVTLDLVDPEASAADGDDGGEYTLVGGGQNVGHGRENSSSWRSRLRRGENEEAVSPFIIPTLRAGMGSDETIAVSPYLSLSPILSALLLNRPYRLLNCSDRKNNYPPAPMLIHRNHNSSTVYQTMRRVTLRARNIFYLPVIARRSLMEGHQSKVTPILIVIPLSRTLIQHLR